MEAVSSGALGEFAQDLLEELEGLLPEDGEGPELGVQQQGANARLASVPGHPAAAARGSAQSDVPTAAAAAAEGHVGVGGGAAGHGGTAAAAEASGILGELSDELLAELMAMVSE